MLKFVNKNNELRYVLQDEDTEPSEVDAKMKEKLAALGIYMTDEEKAFHKLTKTSGISQDDLKHIKGE